MPSKILIVDDHPETLNVVTYILKQRGYEILTAQSGLEGIAIAEKERPDLIILDVMMPEINGYEVCRRLRSKPHFADTPILLFTAKVQVDDKLAGFEAGADDYLTKPTDPAELNRRIKQLLSRHEDMEEHKPSSDTAMVTSPPGPGQAEKEKPPGVLTAVVGARGGAGTTTVAINLATALATQGHQTTLVDLDMVQGHIALYLKQKVSGGLNALAQFNQVELEGELPNYLLPFQDNLHLLLTHYNLDDNLPIVSAETMKTILRFLQRHDEMIIADVGLGLSPATRTLLQEADQIILCVKPERVAISAARQFIHNLRYDLAGQATLKVLMLTLGDQVRVPQKDVERFLEHQLWHMMTINKQELVDAVKAGETFITLQPQGSTAKLFYKMGQQLQPNPKKDLS